MTTEQKDFKIGINTKEDSLVSPKVGTFWKISEYALNDEWFMESIIKANNLPIQSDVFFRLTNTEYLSATDQYETSTSCTFTYINREFKISLTNEQFYRYFDKLNLN